MYEEIRKENLRFKTDFSFSQQKVSSESQLFNVSPRIE